MRVTRPLRPGTTRFRPEGLQLRPRALYIGEQSNLKKGEKGELRPVVIWKALRAHGVPASAIAVATDTTELPQRGRR